MDAKQKEQPSTLTISDGVPLKTRKYFQMNSINDIVEKYKVGIDRTLVRIKKVLRFRRFDFLRTLKENPLILQNVLQMK